MHSDVVGSTVAHLPAGVTSPTLQLAVVENDAGVLISSRHRKGCSARTEVNRDRRRLSLTGGGGSTVAQFPIVVPPPTLQVAVVEDGAGMCKSSSHLVVRVRKGGGAGHVACRIGIVPERDVGHGLTNEKFGSFDASGEVALRGSAAGLERGAGGVKRVIAL